MGKAYLKINSLVKTPLHEFMAVERSGLWAPAVVQSACQYDVTSASVTFRLASKGFIEETVKNFDFITEMPFRFLGFGDLKVSIVIEN